MIFFFGKITLFTSTCSIRIPSLFIRFLSVSLSPSWYVKVFPPLGIVYSEISPTVERNCLSKRFLDSADKWPTRKKKIINFDERVVGVCFST